MRRKASSSRGLMTNPDIGQQILDLLVVVERAPLVDTVGYRPAAQGVLEHERLVVGAVEHSHVAPHRAALAHPVPDIHDHLLGLLAVGVGLEHPDRLAQVAFREAVLLHAFGVADDDRVGRLDDGARRAVVLFQLEGQGLGEVLAEREDIFDLGAPERIDRLSVVADHAYFGVGFREAADDDVLGIVGVLILVHEDVAELLLVAGQHVGAVPQQDVGLQEQVVEIHRSVAAAALAVGVVYRPELGNLQPAVFGGIGGVGGVGAGVTRQFLA